MLLIIEDRALKASIARPRETSSQKNICSSMAASVGSFRKPVDTGMVLERIDQSCAAVPNLLQRMRRRLWPAKAM